MTIRVQVSHLNPGSNKSIAVTHEGGQTIIEHGGTAEFTIHGDVGFSVLEHNDNTDSNEGASNN